MSIGMKRKIVAGLLVVIGLTAVGLLRTKAFAQGAEASKEEWKQESWRIALSLDMPDLIPPVVQYTIFDEDPTPEFEKNLKKGRERYLKRLNAAKDPATKKMIHDSFMEVAWNPVFKKVTGDQISLLASTSYMEEATGLYYTYGSGYSSNTPAGKKWCVTKIVQIKGKPVCWCLPLDTEVGKDVVVVLNKQNVFDLAGVYNKVMGEDPGIK